MLLHVCRADNLKCSAMQFFVSLFIKHEQNSRGSTKSHNFAGPRLFCSCLMWQDFVDRYVFTRRMFVYAFLCASSTSGPHFLSWELPRTKEWHSGLNRCFTSLICGLYFAKSAIFWPCLLMHLWVLTNLWSDTVLKCSTYILANEMTKCHYLTFTVHTSERLYWSTSLKT